jgi:signal transduction histidine kinase
VQKMSTLIDDLLDLAKIETGIGMERESCHLYQIIIDIVERFEELIQSKGLDLRLQIPPGLPPVEANAHRVDQVVSNLIDNAVKYTASGSITVEAFADDQQVTVHISDTGIGLTSQEQTKLFNKFYRAQNKLTRGIEGTGLGLVIAKSIVEQYGGRIWAQSTWQKGSTFAFSLPIGKGA